MVFSYQLGPHVSHENEDISQEEGQLGPDVGHEKKTTFLTENVDEMEMEFKQYH